MRHFSQVRYQLARSRQKAVQAEGREITRVRHPVTVGYCSTLSARGKAGAKAGFTRSQVRLLGTAGSRDTKGHPFRGALRVRDLTVDAIIW